MAHDLDSINLRTFLGECKDFWTGNVIGPFSKNYKIAHSEFAKTIEEQKKVEQQRMDMAFSALTLFGGSLFTSVLGKTTLKALAGQVAVDVICDNNMERAFKVAGFVESNHAAQFVIGKAWSSGEAWVMSKAKAEFNERTFNAPDSLIKLKDPGDMKDSLEQFFIDCKNKLTLAVHALEKSNLDENKKKAEYAKIRSSPFCNPPTQKIYSASLAEELELSFYMKMLLNSDTFLTMNKNGANALNKPITELPSSPNYPSASNPGRYAQEGRQTKGVRYRRIGDVITDKMNKLYRKHLKTNSALLDSTVWEKLTEKGTGSSWWGDIPHRDVLREAENVLNTFGNNNIAKIQQQVRGIVTKAA